MRIQANIANPPPIEENFYLRCEGPDMGLINAWLSGIAIAQHQPDVALKAKAGELPVLPWKGGVAKKLKKSDKIGALQYMAAWQGLRGEDLDIQQGVEVSMTCSRFGVPVLFTDNIKKLLSNAEEDEE